MQDNRWTDEDKIRGNRKLVLQKDTKNFIEEAGKQRGSLKETDNNENT